MALYAHVLVRAAIAGTRTAAARVNGQQLCIELDSAVAPASLSALLCHTTCLAEVWRALVLTTEKRQRGSLVCLSTADFVTHEGSLHSATYCAAVTQLSALKHRAALHICKWNLGVFAESLRPVLQSSAAEAALERYDDIYADAYASRMRAKLSLTTAAGTADTALFEQLFSAMHATAADFSGTFRALMRFAEMQAAYSLVPSSHVQSCHTLRLRASCGLDADAVAAAADELAKLCATTEVVTRNMARAAKIGKPGVPPEQLKALWAALQADPVGVSARFGAPPAALIAELEEEVKKMEAAEAAIARAERLKGTAPEQKSQQCDEGCCTASRLETSQARKRSACVTSSSTAHTAAEDRAAWTQWLTAYADRLRSENLDTAARAAATAAAATANPAYVLRNWIAQEAIDAAEKGDFTVVQSVLDMLTRPSEGEVAAATAAAVTATALLHTAAAVTAAAVTAAAAAAHRCCCAYRSAMFIGISSICVA
eukprot:8719-Heterococcus_DN1.PRE.2